MLELKFEKMEVLCLDLKQKLKEITALSGISGNEDTLTSRLADEFRPFCDDVRVDKFYNVIAVKKGFGENKKKVLCIAHSDEIGFIVKKIEDGGFLRVSNIGGIDPKILPASEVIIHGKEKYLGIIGAKPPHLLKEEDAKKAVKIKDLLVDTGFSKESLEKKVKIGDPITFKSMPVELEKGRLSTKAMDDRAGVVTLIKAAKDLTNIKHENDVIFVASVQEEVGLRGAVLNAYNINPDFAIVVDVGFGAFPEAPKHDVHPLGKGPAIGVGPNMHKKSTKKMMELAKEFNIPYRVDIEPGATGTEANAVQVSREGIPTILMSIPIRYMHTTIETICINDVKNTAALMAKFSSMSSEEMEGCRCI